MIIRRLKHRQGWTKRRSSELKIVCCPSGLDLTRMLSIGFHVKSRTPTIANVGIRRVGSLARVLTLLCYLYTIPPDTTDPCKIRFITEYCSVV